VFKSKELLVELLEEQGYLAKGGKNEEKPERNLSEEINLLGRHAL
jgi:hypothetical protein